MNSIRRASLDMERAEAEIAAKRFALRADEQRLDHEWEKLRAERESVREACRSMLDGLEGRMIVAEAVAKAAVTMALEVHSATDISQAKSAASRLHHVLAWARKQSGLVESAVSVHLLSRAQRRLPTEDLRLRIAAFRHHIAMRLPARMEQERIPRLAHRPMPVAVCHGRPLCATSPFAFCVVAEAQARLETDGFVGESRLFAEIEELGRIRKLGMNGVHQ